MYRVHPWLPPATVGMPGHGLYMPQQGSGRIDNPLMYSVLYLADDPAAAVGEIWGRHAIWTDDLLTGTPSLPGSVTALSTYEGNPQVVNLDDAHQLTRLGIRPSRVVTQNYAHTRAWAAAVFQTDGGDGVRWWSYYDPDWGALGIWEQSGLALVDTSPLTRTHSAVLRASALLSRLWMSP